VGGTFFVGCEVDGDAAFADDVGAGGCAVLLKFGIGSGGGSDVMVLATLGTAFGGGAGEGVAVLRVSMTSKVDRDTQQRFEQVRLRDPSRSCSLLFSSLLFSSLLFSSRLSFSLLHSFFFLYLPVGAGAPTGWTINCCLLPQLGVGAIDGGLVVVIGS